MLHYGAGILELILAPWTSSYRCTHLKCIIAFSRMLLGGYNSQGYIQEKAAVCRHESWGMGMYSIFLNVRVCVGLCVCDLF